MTAKRASKQQAKSTNISIVGNEKSVKAPETTITITPGKRKLQLQNNTTSMIDLVSVVKKNQVVVGSPEKEIRVIR